MGISFALFGFLCWLCFTGSNAPFWSEVGAVFVCALRSDFDGLLEGGVNGGHVWG